MPNAKQSQVEPPFLIAIGGPSCSGKSTVAAALARKFAPATLLATDSYYRDLAGIPPEERAKQNFDHPDAIDWPLLEYHVKLMADGKAVETPAYDFSSHTRKRESVSLQSAPLILVEGLLALYSLEIRAVAGLRIYMNVPEEIALARRVARDTRERGRTRDSVLEQFAATVRPMAEQFILPTRAFADLVLPCDTPAAEAVSRVREFLPAALRNHLL